MIDNYEGTHPKLQIEGRIKSLDAQIKELKTEIGKLQMYLDNREWERRNWAEYLDIIKTYEVDDEVRDRLKRAQVYTLDPPLK